MPSTKSSKGPRLACVTLADMEVFVLGHHYHDRGRIWGLINVSKEEFLKYYSDVSEFQAQHPEITPDEGGYRSAGPDQCTLLADNLGPLRQLLSDQAVLLASAKLNLRLMQKRGTLNPEFHHWALARLMCGADKTEGKL